MTSVRPLSGHVDLWELMSILLCDGSLLSFEGLLPLLTHTPHGCSHEEDHFFPAQEYWSPPGLLGGKGDAGTCKHVGRKLGVAGSRCQPVQLFPQDSKAGPATFLWLIP